MPNGPIYVGLKRVNITIEGALHDAAKKRAEKLKLVDGFSGLVSRLLIRHLEDKSPRIAGAPRRFKSSSR